MKRFSWIFNSWAKFVLQILFEMPTLATKFACNIGKMSFLHILLRLVKVMPLFLKHEYSMGNNWKHEITLFLTNLEKEEKEAREREERSKQDTKKVIDVLIRWQ